jgi:hypothetical protein
MSKPRNPDAVVRAGASENDQLGQQIGSEPSSPIYQPQALRIVVAWAPHSRFNTHSLNGTRITVVSTRRPFFDVHRLSDLRPSNWVSDAEHCDPNVSSKFAATDLGTEANHAAYL